MTKPVVLRTVKLRIKNQARLVNQIAGTYKDVYRALMEYVDNSADAAAVDSHKPRHLRIRVDPTNREVIFEDDCSGMSPEKLGGLLESIGTSTKAHLPWVNGEFGFGVHSFRAFAQNLEVSSHAAGFPACQILVDRESDETQEVPIEEVADSAIAAPTGTRVRIFNFRKGVFKGPYFASSLRKEIEEHFDDVIQAGILEVAIQDTKAGAYSVCRPIDLATFPGLVVQHSVPVELEGGAGTIEVDVKLIEGTPIRHPIVLTRFGRRILALGEVRSFRSHLRAKGRLADVWSHPQLTGRIDIGDVASPNISRDDIQPGERRDALFEALERVQDDLEKVVAASESKLRDRQLDSASRVLSERLAQVMRKFSATFRRPVASGPGTQTGGAAATGVEPGGKLPGGGGEGDVPGAGTTGGAGGGGGTDLGAGGLGSGSRGAHEGGGPQSTSGGSTVAPGGPELLFAHLDPSLRCQLVGYKITVNLDHPAYLARVRVDGLDERILGHIARVISPPLTQKLYEAKGQVPLPLEFGERVVDLAILIEDDFMAHEEDIALAMTASEEPATVPSDQGPGKVE